MSESTFTPADAPAAAAAPATQAPAAAPPAAPAAPPPKVDAEPKVEMTPAQLKARLEEERAKGEKKAAADVSAALGVDIETAKKLIAEAKAKEDAQKSEVQKLTEQLAAEKARLADFEAYKAAVNARATVEFNALDDTQKAAVEALAGADPAARLRTIDTLKPTWAAAQQAAAEAARIKAEAEAAAAATAAKPPPLAPPATTAPPAAPAATHTAPPPNILAEYEALKRDNAFLAARFYAANASKIQAAQAAANSR